MQSQGRSLGALGGRVADALVEGGLGVLFAARACVRVRMRVCMRVFARAHWGGRCKSRLGVCEGRGQGATVKQNLPNGGDDDGRWWGEKERRRKTLSGERREGGEAGRRRKLVYAPEEKRHNGKNL